MLYWPDTFGDLCERQFPIKPLLLDGELAKQPKKALSEANKQASRIAIPSKKMLHSIHQYLTSDTFRNHLENCYWIAGIILVVGVILSARLLLIATKQIEQAKESFRLSCVRESYRIAGERCDFYLSHIIPIQNKLWEAINSKDVQFFKKCKTIVNGYTVKVESTASTDDLKKLIDIVPETTQAYNAMEAFAIYFTSGVADESVGFNSVGYTYCDSVRTYLPQLVMFAKDEKYYQCILKLYFIWNARIDALNIAKQKEQLDAKLKKINNKTINPIGT